MRLLRSVPLRLLVACALLVLLSSPSVADDSGSRRCAEFVAYDGDWTGGWTNTTFESTGSATMSIDVDETGSLVAVNLDINGFVFGASDPAAEEYDGSYDGSGLSFSGSSAVFGDLLMSIDCAGDITGSGSNVPNPGIANATFQGTSDESSMSFTYEVFFTGGGSAVGTMDFAKTQVSVDESSIGEIKKDFEPRVKE